MLPCEVASRRLCAAGRAWSGVRFLSALALTSVTIHAGEIETGLCVSVEAAAGLRGGNHTGKSLQALAIAHALWEKPSTSTDSAPCLRAFASVLAHEGRGPTERFLGDFLTASNIEAHDSVRLYAWWLECERDAWSVRAGALLADEEFGGTDGGGCLINSAFGWPAFISANTVNTGPAFYVAAPGARVTYTVSPATTLRLGVYDGDSFDSADGDPTATRHGLHYEVGGEQGVFIIGELARAPENAATRWKLGVWHHTADFADQALDAAGQPFATSGADPRTHRGNTGAYAVLEHTLAGAAGQPGHLDVFARIGAARANRSLVSLAMDVGLAWTGPLPGRATDVLAVGVAHARFSDDFAHTQRLLDPSAAAVDFEQVWELDYTATVNDRLTVQPGVQFIHHPGGSRALRDAVLATLRLNAGF